MKWDPYANRKAQLMLRKGQHMLTFHEYQLEINRLEAKYVRQARAAEHTRKLIDSLHELQRQGEPGAKKGATR